MAESTERYESYAGFLSTVARDYWESPRRSRIGFLALLLASREAWKVAVEQATTGDSGRKLLTGAAGAAAAGIVLRTLLGGPVGLVLGGASVASLAALYAKHHDRIGAEVERTRALVEAYEKRWTETHAAQASGALSRDVFELAIDGLEHRLLRELEAGAPADPGDEPSQA